MHVATVGERTVGMLPAHDLAGTLWLLVLRLKLPTDSGPWQATVGRAVCAETTHSFRNSPPAATFTFAARGSGATRTIEHFERSAEHLDTTLVELATIAGARSV